MDAVTIAAIAGGIFLALICIFHDGDDNYPPTGYAY